MYLNMNLHRKLHNSFKNCMDFTLRETRKQKLLFYPQVCSRSQGETPGQGPVQGSPALSSCPSSHKKKHRKFNPKDEAFFLKERDNYNLILHIYLY